ncbi:MAG: ribosomal protein arginine hydroxylase [Pseudomonadota bacterium]
MSTHARSLPPQNPAADADPTTLPLPLLGGLSSAQFMEQHWQKKPLLVRQAIPGFTPLLTVPELFGLSQQEDVESRLIVHQPPAAPKPRSRKPAAPAWRLSHGPFSKTSFPPSSQPGWTLLVQGVDLHDDAVHALMNRFRFIPDARLDDLMMSWASLHGGVGPHFDSYDVFLLQAAGRRRWRMGRQEDLSLQEDVPLKILTHFVPEEEHILEPGDMLYLPPRWAHDGIAEDEGCMTYSVGFRVPQRASLAAELLLRMTDAFEDDTLYHDAQQVATNTPAAIPDTLAAFAENALARLLADKRSLACALGEVMTDPKPKVWFEEPQEDWALGAVKLDRRTKMMYDAQHIFINGDSFRAAGADARLMRRLADTRHLSAKEVQKASPEAQELLADWHSAGWLHSITLA